MRNTQASTQHTRKPTTESKLQNKSSKLTYKCTPLIKHQTTTNNVLHRHHLPQEHKTKLQRQTTKHKQYPLQTIITHPRLKLKPYLKHHSIHKTHQTTKSKQHNSKAKSKFIQIHNPQTIILSVTLHSYLPNQKSNKHN